MLEDKIPVKIFGQTYEILGNPSDALYYNTLAQFVEDKMKEIEQSSNIVSSQKIAVLSALNIADELFHEKEHKTDFTRNFDKKYAELIKVLDKALGEHTKHHAHGADDKPAETENLLDL